MLAQSTSFRSSPVVLRLLAVRIDIGRSACLELARQEGLIPPCGD
jgi:hypothetical protein